MSDRKPFVVLQNLNRREQARRGYNGPRFQSVKGNSDLSRSATIPNRRVHRTGNGRRPDHFRKQYDTSQLCLGSPFRGPGPRTTDTYTAPRQPHEQAVVATRAAKFNPAKRSIKQHYTGEIDSLFSALFYSYLYPSLPQLRDIPTFELLEYIITTTPFRKFN